MAVEVVSERSRTSKLLSAVEEGAVQNLTLPEAPQFCYFTRYVG